jgi:predicted Zn-dependent protease
MRSTFRALLPLLAVAPVLGGCVVTSASPVTGRQRAYAYTWEQEMRMGREADREIVARYGTYDDPELEAYVRRVGEAVLATSHLRREGALPEYRAAKFTFRVLDSEAVNAFALPGGFVYVTRGLLAHLDNEAQLAVVLGHEIAHVAARHGSQSALESGLMIAGVLGAGLLGERVAGAGQEIGDLGGVAGDLMLIRYSRDDERESDRLGVEYAALAGYRAEEGVELFTALQRMQARGGRLPGFLSTHPDPGRREEAVAWTAAEWAARGHDGQRVEADAYRARINGITLGQDPREGFDRGGTFHHPAGGFRFPMPPGWQAVRDGREVRMVPRGASGAQVELVARSRHSTAQAAAEDFIRENGLEGAAGYRTNMNGFPGARVDAALEHGGRSFVVTGYWMEHEGAVLRFVGVAESAYGEALGEAVGVMTRGLRTLTDERILSLQPARLALVTTDADEPFRAWVDPRDLPPGMDLEDLAILNGVGVDDVIPAGTVLKLPA